MPEDQYKRKTAYKFRIGELLKGQPIFEGDKFKFLELGNQQITRVNLVGNIIDKFVSEGERKFGAVTIDDASGQIKLRVFSDDIDKLSDVQQGSTIMTIGTLRFFNNEIYVLIETIKSVDTQYLLVRKLETEKQTLQAPIQNQANNQPLRDKIIQRVKASEADNGIDLEKLIMSLDASSEMINNEIQKLLEDGVLFEPRPGRVRALD